MTDATVREGGEAPPFGQGEIAKALAALAKPDEAGEAWRAVSLGDPAAASATAGLWRIEAEDGSWSLVLKLVHHSKRGHENWLSSAEPDDPMYWRREPLAYTSGLLDSLAGGLRAPRCLHSAARPDGSVALWLEDLGGAAESWSLERYGLAARHLGQAQGEFLAGRPLPTERWLSRDWLRAYVERRRDAVERPIPAEAWRTELVRASLPRALEDWARDAWRSHRRTLALLDQLPRTVCHCDFWPPNLFAEKLPGGGERTVAVDWAYVGIGAVGEDVGNLVPDTLFDFFVEAERGGELLEAVRESYLEGLREAGWRGDERLVAFGLAASASVKYIWMLPWLAERALDEEAVAALAAASGIPAAEVFARRGEVMCLLVELDREAKRLANELPFE